MAAASKKRKAAAKRRRRRCAAPKRRPRAKARAKRSALDSYSPGLADNDLDEHDNLRSTVDFRAVYRGLLEQWLDVDAAPILPAAQGLVAPALLKP